VRVTEPESRGGGSVYDMGVYCINAARYLFRDEPIEVIAASASNGEIRFRETAEMTTAILRFPRSGWPSSPAVLARRKRPSTLWSERADGYDSLPLTITAYRWLMS
jgi:predicted dehydrogenase